MYLFQLEPGLLSQNWMLQQRRGVLISQEISTPILVKTCLILTSEIESKHLLRRVVQKRSPVIQNLLFNLHFLSRTGGRHDGEIFGNREIAEKLQDISLPPY